MSKTIADLPSDLPLLPENWVWQPLISLVEPGRGISYGVVQPGSEHDESDGIPIIRVNNLRQGQIQIDDVKRISPEIESKYQRTRIRGGEILMGLVGTLGECAIAPDSIAGWNIARAVGSIPINSSIDPRWVMY